jgi:hypothetical protein
MILALLISAGCIYRPPSKQNTASLSVKYSSELVAAPIKKLGETRGSVEAKLGPPLAVTVERVPNAHTPTQIDEIQTLTYQGLLIRVYKVVELGKEMLLSVRMTQNHPKVLPDLIGRYRKDIVSSFGSPQNAKGEAWEYDDMERHDSVRIEFKGAVVGAVQWDYYVD